MKEHHPDIIEISSLCCRYEGQPVLNNVGFRMEQGEILCLLGPSGSGKTTLLRLLAGLETEYAGRILCNGIDLRGIPPHKRNFGMMFQEYALFPHKSVYGNVAFGLEMKKVEPGPQRDTILGLLETVGLAGFGDRMVDELSGGERQRVALARSLAPNPQLLLLDEPLGSLDRELRERLAVEIRVILKKYGVASVFVTHDQSEAFSIADRVAIMRDGRLEQLDRPENVYRFPKNSTVAGFLGFRNLIDGEITNDGLFEAQGFRLALPDPINAARGACTLLIRPDGARLPDDSAFTGPCLEGHVRSRQFQGAFYRLGILVDGIDMVFDLPIDRVPPAPGEKVSLRILASAMVLLGQESEART